MKNFHIGTAHWAIPQSSRALFPLPGSHLERYAQVFNAVEINSSFYRPHQPKTYARWAASVPSGFQFSVKIPKTITHVKKLKAVDEEWDVFLGQVSHLDSKLGPLLVQLPPSLSFDSEIGENFFSLVRKNFQGDVVFEPRHPTWFEEKALNLLLHHRIARVAADPPPVPQAAQPAAFNGLIYYRLHGSPKMYYSCYTQEFLEALGRKMETQAQTSRAWCIFDNTAEGYAIENALFLRRF